MAWTRRWRIDSQGKLLRVLGALRSLVVDQGRPFEILVRSERSDKTHDQRKLFHALCAEGGPQVGLTPGEAKQAIKRDFYGFEVREVHGRRYELVQSSEDSDRPEYSGLIDFAYRWFAEAGVYIPDSRPR